MKEYCENTNRRAYIINLDPAAEELAYDCDLGTWFLILQFTLIKIDIRDLICLDDALEEMNLGPNGGLVFCIEYFENYLVSNK